MRHLLLLLAFALTASAQTTKVIGVADLQYYWPFEEGTGTTTADRGSGAHTGTLTNTTWTTGLLGRALSFNGTSSKVDVGAIGRAANTQPFSVSFWCTSAADSTNRYAVSTLSAITVGWVVNISGTNKAVFNFFSTAANSRVAASSATLVSGAWNHVVGVWDGSNAASVYLNTVGATNTSSTGTITSPVYTVNMTIGSNSAGTLWWSGIIDDVKYYNHAMTQSEVNYLFYAGRQGSR